MTRARARTHGLGGDAGSAAAELAVALPAVLLALVLGVGALSAAAQQVALQDSAADAARLLARGESAARAAGVIGAAVDGARMSTRTAGDLICASAAAEFHVGRLITVPLRADSCALAGGL